VHELEHQTRAISDYVGSQAIGESVTHAERMAATKVLGRPHEVWDVRTDADRYQGGYKVGGRGC